MMQMKGFSQRLVDRAATLLAGRSSPNGDGHGSGTAAATVAPEAIHPDEVVDPVLPRLESNRRSFLVRTAVVGSALSVAPLDFILRPGTAYANVCGPGASCDSGWTAFCCTVNNGRNSCPPGSFVAGWWKADNSAFCCGSARYILDCNATCPTQCNCRCATGSCDNRRTCCNQFRYGQCNQQISCFGPVVCRVATCTPPWQYDPACTTASLTDNRTVNHSAPCLPGRCSSDIDRKYFETGGPEGFLGRERQRELPTPDRSGRFALYQFRAIYATPATGAHEVHGAIWNKYRGLRAEQSFLGYPVTVEGSIPELGAFFSRFQRGDIYCSYGTGVHEVHGSIADKFRQLGGSRGPLGLPITDEGRTASGAAWSGFERGRIYASFATGTNAVYGAIMSRYRALGGSAGFLGFPLADEEPATESGRQSRFEGGRIYASFATGVDEVYGPILDEYLARGGPGGALGFPTGPPRTEGSVERQDFQGGTLEHDRSTGEVTAS